MSNTIPLNSKVIDLYRDFLENPKKNAFEYKPLREVFKETDKYIPDDLVIDYDQKKATADDYNNIPQVMTPHCSQCVYYDNLTNATMYCYKLQKRITARKQPCKNYQER